MTRGDLRLLRRRWPGAFILIPVAMLSAAGFLYVVANLPWSPAGSVPLVGLSLACVLFALALYAPWSFHWATRALGGIVCLASAGYVFAEIGEGRWWSGTRSAPSVVNAVVGLVVFGIPGLWLLCRPRSRIDPYDPSGAYLGSDEAYVIWVRDASGDSVSDANYVAIARMIRDIDRDNITTSIDGFEEAFLVIRLPRDDAGAQLWRQIEQRLQADGIAYESAVPRSSGF